MVRLSEAGQRFSPVTIVTGVIVPLVVGVPAFVALVGGGNYEAPASEVPVQPVRSLDEPVGNGDGAARTKQEQAEPEAASPAPVPAAPVPEETSTPTPLGSVPAGGAVTRNLDAPSGSVVELCDPPASVRVTLQASLSQVLLTDMDTNDEAVVRVGQTTALREDCDVQFIGIVDPLRGPDVAQLKW